MGSSGKGTDGFWMDTVETVGPVAADELGIRLRASATQFFFPGLWMMSKLYS